MMNEHNLGYRVRQILNHGLALDAEKLARLKMAREQAIARQRVAAPRRMLQWADNLTGNLGASGSLVSRLLLPTAVLVLGLIAINTWRQSQLALEIEEVDTAVLTSDLPLDAYLDKGFDAWLKRSSH